MAETTEIRAKLRVDDAGSPALTKVTKGFGDTNRAAKEAQASFVSFARQAAATAIGSNIGSMASGAKNMALSWIHAAEGPAAAKRQMTAMNMLLRDMPMDKAAHDASQLAADFRKLSLESGISGDSLRGAFSTMLEMGKGTSGEVAKAKDQMSQLAKISEVLEMPIENVAREVSFMEEGMLRTRGHMFQLLNRTGIFGSDIHKAAEEWAKLSDQERMKRIGTALEETAGRVGKLPMTWGRVTGQINNLMEGWKKDFGAPLIEAMVPELEKMVRSMGTGRGEIRHFAEEMGKDVGKWVREAAAAIEKGFAYIETHQKQIRAAIDEGVGKAKAVVEFILANKEVLAKAWGAQMALSNPLVRGIGGAVLGKAAGAVMGGGIAAAGKAVAGGEIGGLVPIAAATTQIVALGAAASAAAGAWYLAYRQFKEFQVVSGGGGIRGVFDSKYREAMENKEAQRKEIERVASGANGGKTNMAQLEQIAESFKRNITATGGNATDLADAQALIDHSMVVAQAAGDQLKHFEEASKGALDYMSSAAKSVHQGGVGTAFSQGKTAGATPFEISNAKYQQAQAAKLVSDAADSAMSALASGNTVVQKQIGDVMAGNGQMVDAFIAAGGATAEQFTALADVVQGSSVELANKLRDAAKAIEDAGSSKKGVAHAVVHNNFSGSTFKIQQDFRDQDPDRVAISFQRDLTNAITRRIGSGSSSPFGM